jgi:hypothetical protein
MYTTVECPECNEDVNVREIVNNLHDHELIELITYLSTLKPVQLSEKVICATNINEELKIKSLYKLFTNLSLEQIENITKQFSTNKPCHTS